MTIKSFKDKALEDFYFKDIKSGIKPELQDRIFRKLKLIDYANSLKDLKSPPGNKLHSLSGKRKNQWAIAVSGPWRLCFYFENGQALDVELIQYH